MRCTVHVQHTSNKINICLYPDQCIINWLKSVYMYQQLYVCAHMCVDINAISIHSHFMYTISIHTIPDLNVSNPFSLAVHCNCSLWIARNATKY